MIIMSMGGYYTFKLWPGRQKANGPTSVADRALNLRQEMMRIKRQAVILALSQLEIVISGLRTADFRNPAHRSAIKTHAEPLWDLLRILVPLRDEAYSVAIGMIDKVINYTNNEFIHSGSIGAARIELEVQFLYVYLIVGRYQIRVSEITKEEMAMLMRMQCGLRYIERTPGHALSDPIRELLGPDLRALVNMIGIANS
ncbi:hypothetical protein COV06_04550 [Candidatus Uhrbacteria bacterium CG10_big_fil_rev_8_21_14_0_10_50_16]|uniref:Uncharacterized protein n=1 Tax=Candidatus Uhrbacteria bacterium CG10_big_fil_rev_8_21_14_0_10_50_16 TaxID=1975039 RepID=A0A2H0RLE7_9BACT|nr:MAG: hypothetical protein COV06_04550 [Candidatus Uhrbacteria bacterium CG10_big_fil_rev_8_21_14_0_10_50_16]